MELNVVSSWVKKGAVGLGSQDAMLANEDSITDRMCKSVQL